MQIILPFLLISIAFELLMHSIPPRWTRVRMVFAYMTLFSVGVSIGTSLGAPLNVFSVSFIVISMYRMFNVLRLIKGRMHEHYLHRVTQQSTVWLLVSVGCTFILWELWQQAHITTFSALAVTMALQLVGSLILLRSTVTHTRRMHTLSKLASVHDIELPSLTVAIPARNETDQLQDCITSLLASHYPKLEILVLDDCSQTMRTPEIIRNFAHQGVRFIKGREPADTWLPKNAAYQMLTETANGELLLFMGVDIRVDPQSLRQLVGYAVEKQKTMVSVMPHNVLYQHSVPLIQPMRYVWELALPRRSFDRPPILSSCWLVHKQALMDAGGFKAASRMVIPEAYFAARQLARDGYSFLASGDALGITSVKDIREQRDTAIRVSYPQLHRRPEIVMLITLAYVAWIAAPAVALIASALSGQFSFLLIAAVVTSVINLSMYATILELAFGKARFLHVFSFPIAALVYVSLMHYSMYKYEFSEVLWKGRNVCLPVMHVVPKLPRV